MARPAVRSPTPHIREMRTRSSTIRAALLLPLVPVLLAACAGATSSGAAGATSASAAGTGAATPACTFVNPIARGADPWVVRRDANYYYVQSTRGAITVYRSSTLTGIRQHGVKVWSPPASGWN